LPNRMIRECALTSLSLEKLSHGAERFFWRLTLVADDFGRFEADPRILRSKCFPVFDPAKISLDEIMAWWAELLDGGLVVSYTVRGRYYGHFPNWARHQRVRNSTSKFPAPPDTDAIPRHVAADRGDMPSSAAGDGDGDGDVVGDGDEDEEKQEGARAPRRRAFRPQINGHVAVNLETPIEWGKPGCLLQLYNAKALPHWERVTLVSPTRLEREGKYLRLFPDQKFWLKAIEDEPQKSSFLQGKSTGRGGKPFRGTFDWLTQKGQKDDVENCVKVVEGRYRDDAPRAPTVIHDRWKGPGAPKRGADKFGT
jgi:hypothetical protein